MRMLGSARKYCLGLAAVAVAGFFAFSPAPAQANSKYAGIVVDAKTGKTLYSSSANAYRYPASLTKIMTLYVVFEELEAGRLSLNSRLKVSKYASGRPPSKLGLKPGSTIKVKDAILALVTKSANDVAVVVAENIGGTEAKFAKRMTRTARQIGMSKTTFRNAHGLPNSKQRTTARDMALLGRAIQERFPSYYKYFKTRSYSYKGRRYGNHNKLLGRVKGVDGIKTGYIRASGFNLVSSVKRNGRHIVAVVMGGRTGRSRDAQMVKLINRYLPKASRGPKTAPALVSRSKVPVFRAADLNNPPRPHAKPILIASSAAPVQANIVTGAIPVPPKSVQARMASSFEVVGAPIPQAMPERELEQGSVDTDAAETTSTTSIETVEPVSGWQIQIAAAETEEGAVKILKRAKSKARKTLRSRDLHTEPVQANGTTLYRARFVGFQTKTAALRACKTLKRAKFACYAIYQ